MMRTPSEYDAFGPWIDQVRSTSDLPRLYRDAGIDPATCRLVLKVPRDIERRNATRDMHLYDHLLVVGEERLTVLSRRGERYDTVHAPFDRIVAIEDSTALLDGRLTMHMANGEPISIAYNASGHAPVQDLVDLLRGLYLPDCEHGEPTGSTAPAAGQPGGRVPDLGDEDLGLLAVYRSVLRREPQMRLVSWAPRRIVTPIPGMAGVLDRLGQLLWPVTLHASIVVTDDREVQVLHRRHWFTSGRQPVWSLARTVFPRRRISGIFAAPHDRYQCVRLITVSAAGAALTLPVPEDLGVDGVLTALAGRPIG